MAVAQAGLHDLKAAARAHGATVNDVILTAVAASLYRLLQARGETHERFVISVPFSARRHADAGELGNRSGVIPVAVAAVGDDAARLRSLAAATAAAKQKPPGASTALLGPLFRLLVRVRVYRRFIDHQRLVHTFVTNVRGPERPLALFGWPVTGMIPLGAITGNVTVAFAVLSYAGTLVVSLIADPETCPDLRELRDVLEDELETMTRQLATPEGPAPAG
ncbi:hypothetical protein D477_006191 [Arthrobacter crystallopoietes BAB-32]|uniref:O-acyltransferase WSD1 C-terminal domain-containing protein n=1 Tax=Arthrobacter crystallopoietes BAB-32 TaxID=1246476 RepID=N1UXE7_9MICC|nr:hypothetical protein D477_006191 [Arthrobacter crystallopoietes BAB-32]